VKDLPSATRGVTVTVLKRHGESYHLDETTSQVEVRICEEQESGFSPKTLIGQRFNATHSKRWNAASAYEDSIVPVMLSKFR
jgi:hypothetical protein